VERLRGNDEEDRDMKAKIEGIEVEGTPKEQP
jgi:hypothetical protein